MSSLAPPTDGPPPSRRPSSSPPRSTWRPGPDGGTRRWRLDRGGTADPDTSGGPPGITLIFRSRGAEAEITVTASNLTAVLLAVLSALSLALAASTYIR